ncbi:uncharacterized protein J8A68_000477 [[Candida] subhashii]|uniref:Inhibitor I9 domain-containing protein n=1 Tax=[Candida] subhashii TaxID=561895 RepID=A0A8J5UUT1_9ASCO|nr:uncharacterized protein J8A68_000477 [[Candida] subhashii]KAG7666047.1 hypothetical protein J8A68_000477 [[Candida] subhashii]
MKDYNIKRLIGILVLTVIITISIFVSSIGIPLTPKATILSTSTSATSNNKAMGTKPYIITLKEDASDEAVSGIKKWVSEIGGEITSEYELIKGFAVKLPVGSDAQALEAHTAVHSVEEDQEVHIQ